MTKKRITALRASTGIHKRVFFKYKGSSKRYEVGTVTDVVGILSGEYHHLLQRIEVTPELRHKWGTRFAFRSCYYTLTARSRKPAWGQYHQLVRQQDFQKLMRKARNKGWL